MDCIRTVRQTDQPSTSQQAIASAEKISKKEIPEHSGKDWKSIASYNVAEIYSDIVHFKKTDWVNDSIKEIDLALKKENPTLFELTQLYRKITCGLLKQPETIQERSINKSFKKVSIDIDLFISIRSLILRVVNIRYALYDQLDNDHSRMDWIANILTKDDQEVYRSNINENKHNFPYLANIEAWSYILRDIFTNNINLNLSKASIKAVAVFLYKYLMPDNSYNMIEQPFFNREQDAFCFQGMTDDIADQVELYALFTSRHDLLQTGRVPNNFFVSDEGSFISLPDFKQKNIAPQDPRLHLYRSEGMDSEMFFKEHTLSCRVSRMDKLIIAILNPGRRQLLIVPGKKDEGKNLLKKVKSKVNYPIDEPVNILFFPLTGDLSEEIENLTALFPSATQINIATTFRELTKYKECGPNNHLWTLQNYNLFEKHLTDFQAEYFSLTFHTISHSFILRKSFLPNTNLVNFRNSILLSSPFTWSKDRTDRISRGLLWSAMSFALTFYDQFKCPITEKTISEIEDPCFDENGVMYEKNDLIVWLKENKRNPSTNERMTIDDIKEMPQLKSMIFYMKSIFAQYSLDNISSSIGGVAKNDIIEEVESNSLQVIRDKEKELSEQIKQYTSLMEEKYLEMQKTSKEYLEKFQKISDEIDGQWIFVGSTKHTEASVTCLDSDTSQKRHLDETGDVGFTKKARK